MIDGTLALQPAISAVLRAHAGVAALVAKRVYDIAPPRRPGNLKQNFISFGPVQALPFGRDDDRGCSVFQQIDCWAEAEEAGVIQAIIARRMTDAVSRALPPDAISGISGWLVHGTWVESTQVLRDPDQVTAHGIVNIRVDMTPDI